MISYKFLEKYPKLYAFATEPKWKQVRGVVLFFVITVAIHIIWRFWARNLNYAPITGPFYEATNMMAYWVYNQSIWIITNILNISITLAPDQIMWLKNGTGIQITASCSGLKPIIQFFLLMLIFPGPWKRKLWFIPSGILIVHLTNLVRVAGMAITGVLLPGHLKFVHDNILRAMFYVVIFVLWWLWVEKIGPGKKFRPDGKLN